MVLRTFRDARPVIDDDAYVDPCAVIIGDVKVLRGAGIWPHAVLRADEGRVIVGQNVVVLDGAVVTSTASADTVLGRNSFVGQNAVLRGCVLGRFAQVRHGSVVCEGVHLADFSVVSEGTVLAAPGEERTHCLYAGNPAVHVRPLSESDLEAAILLHKNAWTRARVYRESVRVSRAGPHPDHGIRAGTQAKGEDGDPNRSVETSSEDLYTCEMSERPEGTQDAPLPGSGGPDPCAHLSEEATSGGDGRTEDVDVQGTLLPPHLDGEYYRSLPKEMQDIARMIVAKNRVMFSRIDFSLDGEGGPSFGPETGPGERIGGAGRLDVMEGRKGRTRDLHDGFMPTGKVQVREMKMGQHDRKDTGKARRRKGRKVQKKRKRSA